MPPRSGQRIFTEEQRTLLTAALNRIIPAQDQFPGAGDLDGAAYLEQAVIERAAADKAAGRSPDLRRLFTEGLAQLEIAAAQHGSAPFPELPPARQDDILRQLEAEQPDFFAALVRQGYNGYYTNPDIFELIGYTIPNPQDYRPLPFDERLLEPQRRRGQLWREV